MCFYYYKVTVYDEDYKEYTEAGYTVGEDYRNAMNHLTEHYGEGELIKATLEYIADRPMLVLPNGDLIAEKGLKAAIKENNNI